MSWEGRKKENSDWQISFARDVQVVFLKITALFWYYFFSISFVTSIFLLLTIKKLAKSIFMPFLAF